MADVTEDVDILTAVDFSDGENGRRLRERNQRPYHRRAAEQCDELASLQGISSVRESHPTTSSKSRVVHHSILARPTSATGQPRNSPSGLWSAPLRVDSFRPRF